ncbi:Ig-like domain-containing domain [Hymenobacter cheonanensis]|uniref:Ig-like domain-containing domain n=1 Tax=Hymenobacter sp. CA2-7 TaxID=3063993 RepID=UPI0027123F6A|nr:Ig-like domain-containing domain [Hymenobacter sp. CA2-7]MDO7884874.1 Ig-like domain-containing domain [Hymenobacter sp. CA2-7]
MGVRAAFQFVESFRAPEWASRPGRGAGAGLALAGLLALGSCAAISSPQGGPRDKTPPRLIATSPDSAARNVKQQFIRLKFSEPIQLKELSKNLLITPQLPADNSYSVLADRDFITLTFKKPLEANTTYSFNFRKAIVDANESLPAKYQALSFSTGATLDSGRVRGTVRDFFTTRPAADILVGLYRTTDTVTVRRGQPYYLARTDDKGQFQLNFVRVAAYNLYAWADKNNNNRFDDGEKIGYLPAPVFVSDTTAPRTLLLVRPDRLPPRRTGIEATAAQVRVTFNEGLQAATLAPLAADAATQAAVQSATELADQGRSVLIYKTPAVGDGRYLLAATDSVGNQRRDTISVRFPVPNAAGKKAPAPAGTAVVGNPRSVYRQGQVKFRFPVPVQLVAGKSPGTLTEDSLRTHALRVPAEASLSATRTELTVNLDTKALKNVEIRLDSTAILAVTGQSLYLRRPLRLPVVDQDPSGQLTGTLKTAYKSFDLQLLDEKYQVLAQLHNPRGTYRFNYLAPGKYRLRVLIDQDGDGRWRGADPNLRLAPEPVYLYPKLLEVRAGFEIEEPLSF